MSYSATVFHVLIASPSDVPEERNAIAASLHDWNSLHSRETGKVLLPVMWESHSAPSMADRPQGVINEQVVKSCDMLIGAFWTRLGTPTGVEDSGTVEEIKWFLKQGKPVMLYYSDAPINPNKIDTKQFDKLETFKKEIRNKGIQEQYSSIEELKMKLSRQITIVMRGMSVNPVVSAAAIKAAKASTKEGAIEFPVDISPPPSPSLQAEKIFLEEYTDKSFVVRGDSRPYKDEIKKIGGKWIKLKDGTYAWMFSKRRINEVAGMLGIDPL